MLDLLRQRLAEEGVISEETSASSIVIRSIHDAMADIKIHYHDHEFTVEFTHNCHIHFDCQSNTGSELDHIVEFISDFVSDRVVLTIVSQGTEDMYTRLDNIETGESSIVAIFRTKQSTWARIGSFFFKHRKSTKSYRWSGPVPQYISPQSIVDPTMTKVAESISELDELELAELVKALEEEFGIEDREE